MDYKMTPIEMGKELINLSATPYFQPQIREGGTMLIQMQNKIELLEAEITLLKLQLKNGAIIKASRGEE